MLQALLTDTLPTAENEPPSLDALPEIKSLVHLMLSELRALMFVSERDEVEEKRWNTLFGVKEDAVSVLVKLPGFRKSYCVWSR